MLPLALLFSSDEQASHSLSQALTELEFAVERCPEIFGAVEKITSRAFDIIVSDWHEGLEAAFLLKTSRELKANHAAFTIAVADPEAAEVAREAGADLILSRPASADEVKYALLTSDVFLGHMKTWLPKLGFSDMKGDVKGEEEVEKNAEVLPVVTRTGIAVSELPRNVRVWPSSLPPASLKLTCQWWRRNQSSTKTLYTDIGWKAYFTQSRAFRQPTSSAEKSPGGFCRPSLSRSLFFPSGTCSANLCIVTGTQPRSFRCGDAPLEALSHGFKALIRVKPHHPSRRLRMARRTRHPHGNRPTFG